MSSRPPNSRHRPQQEDRKLPKATASEPRHAEREETDQSPVHAAFEQAETERASHAGRLNRGDHHDTSHAIKVGAYKPTKQKNRHIDRQHGEMRTTTESLTAGIQPREPMADWVQDLYHQKAARGIGEGRG